MFGINKKKEAGEELSPLEEKGTESEIQFDFEEDDKLPFDDDEGFAEEDAGEDAKEDGPAPRGLRQTFSRRPVILLGLLLLLALGGGGYYYLNSTPVPLVEPPAPVKTTVKVQAAVAPKAAPAPAAEVKPATPVPVAADPVKTPQTPVVKTPAAPVAPTVPVATKTPIPATTRSEVVSPPVQPAIRQPFTLSVGAFLNQQQQREIEKKIRHLGYTPKEKTTYSMVPMTRLLLGVYDPAVAETRRKELVAQVPDLFTLKQGDKVALYAGSYQSLDQARIFADQLYLRGIHVDEESVSLRLPLKQISYGSFASRTAAEKAAKRGVAAGLPVQVVKR